MFDLPEGLESCDPKQRNFPIAWKEAYFRKYFNKESRGYKCPNCKEVFRGSKGFKYLHADHIQPYSKGGLTIWSNLQLLCLSCNYQKSNKTHK